MDHRIMAIVISFIAGIAYTKFMDWAWDKVTSQKLDQE